MAVNGGFERPREVATGYGTVTYDATADCRSKIFMKAFDDRGTKLDEAADTSLFAFIGAAVLIEPIYQAEVVLLTKNSQAVQASGQEPTSARIGVENLGHSATKIIEDDAVTMHDHIGASLCENAGLTS